MVDIPGNGTTTRTIAVGGTTSDTLEFAGDTDWFKIQLTAGQQISVILEGLGLADPIVRIRNSAGTVIFQNDDWGDGLDSFVGFAAPTTGTYYIDVGSAPNNQTGAYQLSVTPYAPPPFGTVDDIAHQLTHGYWNGDVHHFDVSANGSITVNLTGLSAPGLAVARQALAIWTDIIGVNFIEVTSGAQIAFAEADEGTGAFSTAEWANGITSSATVNVAPSRLNLHTYLHEIAHALGLGHAGDYNGGTAFSRYPYEAMWLNDGAAVSIMSYFDNGENTYYANLGFTNTNIVTPQLADIIAMGNLYGLSTATRLGDTTYGFNNNSGRDIFNAVANPNVAYTVFDSGGVDTLDYSGFVQNQLINLNAESFSNVGSGRGNVSIARGVVIENAIGGNGSDTLIGNAADNLLSGRGGTNTYTGGAGNDTFCDTRVNLNGDTITDFSAGDRIILTDATLSGFTFSFNTGTKVLTFTGGSVTLSGGLNGTLTATAAAGGGVQLLLTNADAANDFNGDGRSDILWRNDDGTLTDWLGQMDGSFAPNSANFVAGVGNEWTVVATGDFNGDLRDDILWRDAGGAIGNWLGQANGGFTYHSGFAGGVALEWSIAGVGDFNGDQKDDILWRNTNGTLTNWLGQADGGFTPNNGNFVNGVANDWAVAGIGDFNGDGKDDILWHNTNGTLTNWLGAANGGFTPNNGNFVAGVGDEWSVAGIGDFNGDGKDDILWRNDDGLVTDWLGAANGSFTPNSGAFVAGVGSDWTIVQIGDFDGDRHEDILWRNTNGTVSNWLGQPNGGFLSNGAIFAVAVGNDWHIQPPDMI